MDSDTRAATPFPGQPIGADLYGRTLTIYYPFDPATGRYPTATVTSTVPWTATQLHDTLTEYGIGLRSLRTTHALDAFAVAAGGVAAVAERVASGARRAARFAAIVVTVRAAGRHA